jgi:hypothetical protein
MRKGYIGKIVRQRLTLRMLKSATSILEANQRMPRNERIYFERIAGNCEQLLKRYGKEEPANQASRQAADNHTSVDGNAGLTGSQTGWDVT